MSPRNSSPSLQPPGLQAGPGEPALIGAEPEGRAGPPAKRSRRRLVAAGLVGLVVLAGGVSAKPLLWADRKADIRDGTTLVTADGMAARHGIAVAMIGVTAAGGLIDFRYQVVDPDKATPVVHDLNLFPKLIAEDTGATLVMRSLPHNHKAELQLGGTYFFLLPNAANALHKGSRVTLVIGDARIEHIVVKG
jgi:hypothetical protein